MSFSNKILELLRQQTNLEIDDFCLKFKINLKDYLKFKDIDNISQFPDRIKNKLKLIMVKLETENILEYKINLSDKGYGYFSNYKILNHLDKLNEMNSTPKKVGPITVEFHPTNICNHSCPACTFSIPKRSKNIKNMYFDIRFIDQLIADLKKLNTRAIVISGGGEPLCHDNISQIINNFSSKFDVGLVTNGSKLSDNNNSQKAKYLRKDILKNCTWCRISVDAGSQKIYEIMHGKKSTIIFDTLISNIKLLAKEKIESNSNITLGISFLLTPNNFLDLIKSICIFREIKGIDYFQIKPIVLRPIERINDENMIFWDKKIFKILANVKKYEKENFKIYTISHKFIDLLSSEDNRLPFKKCWGHPYYPTISADGSILICCHMLNFLFEGKNYGCYGKISHNKTFYKIWTKSKRFNIGDRIDLSHCPLNCKLSETNKVLEKFHTKDIYHVNFIN